MNHASWQITAVDSAGVPQGHVRSNRHMDAIYPVSCDDGSLHGWTAYPSLCLSACPCRWGAGPCGRQQQQQQRGGRRSVRAVWRPAKRGCDVFLQPGPHSVPRVPAAVRVVHTRSAGGPHPTPPGLYIAFLLPPSPIPPCSACTRLLPCHVHHRAKFLSRKAVFIGSVSQL